MSNHPAVVVSILERLTVRSQPEGSVRSENNALWVHTEKVADVPLIAGELRHKSGSQFGSLSMQAHRGSSVSSSA